MAKSAASGAMNLHRFGSLRPQAEDGEMGNPDLPVTRNAVSGDVNIAYQTMDSGPGSGRWISRQRPKSISSASIVNFCCWHFSEVKESRWRGPLTGAKRTSSAVAPKSENDPKRTSGRLSLVLEASLSREGIRTASHNSASRPHGTRRMIASVAGHPRSECDRAACS